MIDRAVLSVSVVVLLLILALALFLMVPPLFHRLEFDMLCQDWMRRMDAGGGLSMRQRFQFAGELISRGYRIEQLTATESAAFGDTLTMHVHVARPARQIGPDLAMKEVVISLKFTRMVICRKIITAAGDQ